MFETRPGIFHELRFLFIIDYTFYKSKQGPAFVNKSPILEFTSTDHLPKDECPLNKDEWKAVVMVSVEHGHIPGTVDTFHVLLITLTRDIFKFPITRFSLSDIKRVIKSSGRTSFQRFLSAVPG